MSENTIVEMSPSTTTAWIRHNMETLSPFLAFVMEYPPQNAKRRFDLYFEVCLN